MDFSRSQFCTEKLLPDSFLIFSIDQPSVIVALPKLDQTELHLSHFLYQL